MFGAIWAQTRDGVIGFEGGMPWHLPEDLAHFKEITLSHPVLMGRATWQSLPEQVRPLPGRRNLVLSSRAPGEWSRGAEVLTELPEPDAEVWVMGGAQVYNAMLADAATLEVTVIDAALRPRLGDAAVLAPEIPAAFELVSETGWRVSETGRLKIDDETTSTEPVRYRFQRYERKDR